MEIIQAIWHRELGPQWLRGILVLPADAVTLMSCLLLGDFILRRLSTAYTRHLATALSGVVFLTYFIAIRPHLSQSPMLAAFPYFFSGILMAVALDIRGAADPHRRQHHLLQSVAQLAVPVPVWLLWSSMLLGGVAMVTFTAPHALNVGQTSLGTAEWFPSRPLLDRLAWLQAATALILGTLSVRLFHERSALRRRQVVTAVVLLLVFAIGVELIAEEFLFKASFMFGRRVDRPAGSSSILRALGLAVCDQWSRPSGLVIRQMMLLLAGIQVAAAERSSRKTADTLMLVAIIAFSVGIIAFRINGTVGGLFDVGMGIGLGIMLFWLLVVVGTTLLVPSKRSSATLAGFTWAQAIGLGYVVTIAFTENARAGWWLIAASATTAVLLLLRQLAQPNSPSAVTR